MSETATIPVEQILRDELAGGDVVISTTVPILRHLLANDDHALFTDEVVARVRGVISDLARQMLFALAEATGDEDRRSFAARFQDPLTIRLMALPGLLGHVHALALEYHLAAQLARRHGFDPVLSPLIQERIASGDAQAAAQAMQTLAAQSRFFQQLQRMELPLSELPGELFDSALAALRGITKAAPGNELIRAEQALREAYDETGSRLGQMTHLLSSLGGAGHEALSLAHAGLSLFASALALFSGQDRPLTMLSLNERQAARMAVGLRAAGLNAAAIEGELFLLHPDTAPPAGLDTLTAEGAAALLADANPVRGG